MTERVDVSRLPTYAFGQRSLLWWGTLGMIAIEGTVFAIALVAYFYLRGLAHQWPPAEIPPDLLFGTLNTAVMLVSGIPNHLASRAAQKEDRRRVQLLLLVCVFLGLVFLVLRACEFATLNTTWNANAYGSIVFALLALHTAHIVTDFVDTVVLTVLMIKGPVSGKRFVDVEENAEYWWFVIVAWLPIYFTVYLVPRWFP